MRSPYKTELRCQESLLRSLDSQLHVEPDALCDLEEIIEACYKTPAHHLVDVVALSPNPASHFALADSLFLHRLFDD